VRLWSDTVADPQGLNPDSALDDLFAEFEGRLVSPGAAAALLGLSRKTVYTLGERGVLRVYRGQWASGGDGYKWVLIPLEDIGAYAKRVGRPIPKAALQ
jgi:hypothetical protein